MLKHVEVYTYGIELVKTLMKSKQFKKRRSFYPFQKPQNRVHFLFTKYSCNSKNLSQVFLILFNYPLD